MSKARLYSKDGTYKSEIDLPESHFAQPIKMDLIHTYVMVYSGNQRQGTSKTKGRSEVSGGGTKPWKQKGTGRARAGSNTSPIWVRGGKAHGATPRDYTRKLNKKMKQQALLSALSLKAGEKSVHVFEDISLSEPKTKELAGILQTASLSNKKNLILTSQPQDNLLLAVRNIPASCVSRVQDVNTYEVMNSNNLIITTAAMELLTEKKG
jgi:large subunit ribosomal protein L4